MKTLRRVWAGIVLFGIFLYDLVAASWVVAKLVLHPGRKREPAIVLVPVDAQTNWGVALFAYLVSVTPGSTCVHISDDRRALYVHLLHAPDRAASVAGIKALYERQILKMEGVDTAS